MCSNCESRNIVDNDNKGSTHALALLNFPSLLYITWYHTSCEWPLKKRGIRVRKISNVTVLLLSVDSTKTNVWWITCFSAWTLQLLCLMYQSMSARRLFKRKFNISCQPTFECHSQECEQDLKCFPALLILKILISCFSVCLLSWTRLRAQTFFASLSQPPTFRAIFISENRHFILFSCGKILSFF